MGGLKPMIDEIWQQKLSIAYRPPALIAAGANTIFVISGGPVVIEALFAHQITANAAGSTFTIAISGAGTDNGPVVCTSAINTLIVSPLDPTLVQPIVPNLAISAAIAAGFQLLAVPGNIVLTVVTTTTGTLAWYCIYRRMNPASSIV